MKLAPPGNSILLHVCCAPCSGAIIEALCAEGFRPTVFWSNSNICTAAENDKRLSVLLPYAAKFGVPVVTDEYDHSDWLAFVKGQLSGNSASGRDLASYPERGPRCLMCFRYRLLRAARYAADSGFDCLTTSLASSRWKSLEQVDDAGIWAVSRALEEVGGAAANLRWWPQNWRKGGLQPRRSEIIKEQNFYNQAFCGCEFSLPEYSDNKQINNQSICPKQS